jgi:thymidylate synthase
MQVFESFDEAFISTLRRLRDTGRDVEPVRDVRSIGSQFGTRARGTKELVAETFAVRDVTTRLMAGTARSMNLAFAIANTLFTIAGHDDDAMISAYNERSRVFLEDGKLRGAVGCRMFGPSPDDMRNQFTAAAEVLRSDPTSRRAVVQVLTPADLYHKPLDTPCTIALQFLIRDGALELVTIMRSQSAVMVMPYDLFLFSMIQEMLACELSLSTGNYYHVAGSFHYYDEEQAFVDQCVDAPLGQIKRMPRMTMPILFNSRNLLATERALREQLKADPSARTDDVLRSADPYWRELLLVLANDLRRRYGCQTNCDESSRVTDMLSSERNRALPS